MRPSNLVGLLQIRPELALILRLAGGHCDNSISVVHCNESLNSCHCNTNQRLIQLVAMNYCHRHATDSLGFVVSSCLGCQSRLMIVREKLGQLASRNVEVLSKQKQGAYLNDHFCKLDGMGSCYRSFVSHGLCN